MHRKLATQNLGELIRSLIFFILFYLYLWLKVDLRLIYHGGGAITNFPAFYRGWNFFLQFTSYPGGPIEYLCAFLSQFFYYSWVGAIVVTLVAWLICICTDIFIKAINAHQFRWIRFIPPVLLLITFNRYTYHFATITAFLVALFFVCLYIKATKKSGPVSLLAFFVLSLILYYITGGAYLLFAALCAIYELFIMRRWQLGLVYLFAAVVIPYLAGVFIFRVSIVDAYSRLSPFSWEILKYESCKSAIIMLCALYLLLPLTTLGLALWWALLRNYPGSAHQQPNPPQTKEEKKLKKIPRKKKLRSKKTSWYTHSLVLRWSIESCLLLAVAGAIAFFSHDEEQKNLIEVDYFAYYKMWPQAIRAARRQPNSYLNVHSANRALYHTGQLGSEMFSFYQTPHTLFLTLEEFILAYWRKFDMYLDLGHINKAEHELVESLGVVGEHPLILKRLALINMAKANYTAAKVYLGLLSKTLFHADWANTYLERLKHHPNLSNDDRILRLRSLMVDNDRTWEDFENEHVLFELLNQNRKNHMAFEYLMAWYLLTKQLDKFIINLNRLDDFDYPKLPSHYEEAILVYMFDRKRPVDLRGRQISLESHRRFEAFRHTLAYHRGNTQTAYSDLAGSFRNSYMFYYFYSFAK
ncbi:MAG: DUF6057 family protein [Planctomycetota bacterium]